MIRVGKVNIEQYLPYSLRRDQLPSEEEALRHPISDTYRPNREHLDHSIMNERLCLKNMYNKYIYDDVAYTDNQYIYGDNNNNDDTNLSTIIIIIIISNHHQHRNTIIIDRYHPFHLIMIVYSMCDN